MPFVDFNSRFDVFPLNRYVDRQIFQVYNLPDVSEYVSMRESTISKYLDVADDFVFVTLAAVCLPSENI